MEETIYKSRYKRKNYCALDIAKFICAIFIIAAHFASEWAKSQPCLIMLFLCIL